METRSRHGRTIFFRSFRLPATTSPSVPSFSFFFTFFIPFFLFIFNSSFFYIFFLLSCFLFFRLSPVHLSPPFSSSSSSVFFSSYSPPSSSSSLSYLSFILYCTSLSSLFQPFFLSLPLFFILPYLLIFSCPFPFRCFHPCPFFSFILLRPLVQTSAFPLGKIDPHIP